MRKLFAMAIALLAVTQFGPSILFGG